ncbi:unnamed protein product, partial [Meganyctiphanes norvegica]
MPGCCGCFSSKGKDYSVAFTKDYESITIVDKPPISINGTLTLDEGAQCQQEAVDRDLTIGEECGIGNEKATVELKFPEEKSNELLTGVEEENLNVCLDEQTLVMETSCDNLSENMREGEDSTLKKNVYEYNKDKKVDACPVLKIEALAAENDKSEENIENDDSVLQISLLQNLQETKNNRLDSQQSFEDDVFHVESDNGERKKSISVPKEGQRSSETFLKEVVRSSRTLLRSLSKENEKNPMEKTSHSTDDDTPNNKRRSSISEKNERNSSSSVRERIRNSHSSLEEWIRNSQMALKENRKNSRGSYSNDKKGSNHVKLTKTSSCTESRPRAYSCSEKRQFILSSHKEIKRSLSSSKNDMKPRRLSFCSEREKMRIDEIRKEKVEKDLPLIEFRKSERIPRPYTSYLAQDTPKENIQKRPRCATNPLRSGSKNFAVCKRKHMTDRSQEKGKKVVSVNKSVCFWSDTESDSEHE